jgi:hypothetical protein
VVLARFLYGPDGFIRLGRLIPLLGLTLMMALFGGALIWLTPRVTQNEAGRALWVIFAVLMLKMPLVLLLWYFVRRNMEWPGRPVRWRADEVDEILEYLEHEAIAAVGGDSSEARLAYLSREAWNVADQVGGELKVDALTVALRIDELQAAEQRRRTVDSP